MLWILTSIALIFAFFGLAKLRGFLFGIALTTFIAFLFLLSRFHLRKSIILLGALMITAMILGLFTEYLKSRKK